MGTFGSTKVLIIERFDRHWAKDGRLLRLPQEDCYQALSIPPVGKYQSDGGPSLKDILRLLQGSDTPKADQCTIIKAQILFCLTGVTDGHAKTFSVSGTYRLTPLYDFLTAQPCLIDRKQMRLAMSVGDNNHYRMDEVHGRHFLQTGTASGLSKTLVSDALDEMAEAASAAIE